VPTSSSLPQSARNTGCTTRLHRDEKARQKQYPSEERAQLHGTVTLDAARQVSDLDTIRTSEMAPERQPNSQRLGKRERTKDDRRKPARTELSECTLTRAQPPASARTRCLFDHRDRHNSTSAPQTGNRQADQSRAATHEIDKNSTELFAHSSNKRYT
jgi:hypothetical protein